MMRNVYLQGELGSKFGNKFKVNTNNYQEIFKCISANRPEFVPYLKKCEEQDIGFIIETAGKQIDEESLLFPVKEGDVTISIVPAGSKSGIGKILAAVVLTFVLLPHLALAGIGTTGATAGAAAAGAGKTATLLELAMAGATSGKLGMAVALAATNLATAGIQQMMAPDPATDSDAPDNYSFNGNAQNIKQGDPVPLLYGELRIPGRPISINVDNTTPTFVGYYEDGTGSTDPVDQDGGGNTSENAQTSLH